MMPFLLAALLSVGSITAPPFDLASRSVLFAVKAAGAQIYECKAVNGAAPTWALREPIATLIKDGRTIGRHFAGPTWQFVDGSTAMGKLVASAPAATSVDVPELELQIVSHSGQGALAKASTVYRINTLGGQLSGLCPKPSVLKAVPYSATYLFAR